MKQNKKPKIKNRIYWLSGFVGLVLILIVLVSIQEKQNSEDEAEANDSSSGVTIGTKAPKFTLESTHGPISLSDYKGKNVVLYFYEGNGCRACIEQLNELNEKIEQYEKHNTVILAATTDPVTMSKQAAEIYDIKIPILFDENQKIGEPYGVTDVPGGMDMGPVDTHSVFIIDKEGIISWFDISPKEMYVPIDKIDEELQKLWD